MINSNVEKFLTYMSRPLTLQALDVIYTSNNIVFERVDLYKDFILTLNNTIFLTYLGDEHTDDDEKLKHFEWCWKNVSEKLAIGSISFNDNTNAYIYFINFYIDSFYNVDKSDELELINKISEVWTSIFDYNSEKPRTDLDTFLTLYRVFEKTLKKH